MKNPVIDEEGNKKWLDESGELCRIDGPAIEYADGDKLWCEKGQLHRLNGPAIELANGYKAWFLKGKELSEDLHTKLTGDIKDLPLYLGLGWNSYISERLK